MVEPTFSTTAICSAMTKLLGEEIVPDAIYLNKSRGYWPLEEDGRGWTRYGLADATRIYVMMLGRRRGLGLAHACRLASAKHWWPALGEQHRYLLATNGEPEFAREGDLADRLAEEGGFAVVVDVKAETERLRATLAKLGEQVDLPDHTPAAVRARVAKEQKA